MGMRVPEVEMEAGGEPVFPGLMDASPAMDAAVSGMNEVMKTLLDYIETVATIWRLATEIEKTQRRINAIENVFIPESRTTVNWIRSVMEENEREELFRRKLLKNKSEH
jgi:V/A-type H+-transporting ATPase subunit D